MSQFPLLRLPLLPFKDVMDMLCFGELLSLQLCSARTRQFCELIKKSISIDSLSPEQKDKLNALEKYMLLRLEIYNNPLGSIGCFSNITITIANDGIKIKIDNDYSYADRHDDVFPIYFNVKCMKEYTNYEEKRGNIYIDRIRVPMVIQNNLHISTFWANQSYGLKNLVNYFKRLFNSQSIRYYIEGSWDWKFSQNLKTAIRGMSEQTINMCDICRGEINDDDYTLILDNIHPTICFEHVNHTNSVSDDFKPNTITFKSEYLKLEPANWFTFDNLITTDCKCIALNGSRLTNSDMCNYLKLWMDGKFPKLKFLDVELGKPVNLKFIFSGLKSYSKTYTVFQENDAIRFKRNDTLVASFVSTEYIISFEVYI